MQIQIPQLDNKGSLALAEELNNLNINEEVILDFNHMKNFDPFGMLVATSTIRNLRKSYAEIPFKLLSDTCGGAGYAGHMGFFKAISPKLSLGKEPGEALGSENYIPITKIDLRSLHNEEIKAGNYMAMGDAIEKKATELACIITRNNNIEITKLLTYLIREIMRNTIEHSENDNIWICGQYWPSFKLAEIALMDEGIGIYGSLCKNRRHREYITSNAEALEWSVKAGISQAFQPSDKGVKSDDVWSNSGFGLFMVSQICKNLGGYFYLASKDKYLKIAHNCDVELANTHFDGTAVGIRISVDKIENAQKIISEICTLGEQEAKEIRNAFKTASIPSKGLLSK